MAAAMAILRLGDVGATEKLALLVVACRAERGSIAITRSLPALAADMGVSERTASRAIQNVAVRGYLQIAHRLGTTRTYTLGTPVNLTGVTPDNLTGVPPTDCPNTPDKMSPVKRKTREKQEGGDRPPALSAAVASVDNGTTHPPDCGCGGTGWVDGTGGVTRCEH